MHENQNETGKFARFFEEKGFYIILFLCVAAIGIAGYVLFLDPQTTKDEDSLLTAELDIAGDQESSTVIPNQQEEAVPLAGGDGLNDHREIPVVREDTAESIGTPETSADTETLAEEPALDGDSVIREAVETIAAGRTEQQEPEQKPTEEPKKEEDSAPTFFVRPVSGEILREFSGDELVYDRTMGDWRTHNGVDFQAADGALVSVVADGVVEDVYRDEYYGTGILVNHGGGLMSVYLGLIENATVSKGESVTAGDTIGAVSAATLFESLEQAHLHVEMTLNGQRVNPMDYIPM